MKKILIVTAILLFSGSASSKEGLPQYYFGPDTTRVLPIDVLSGKVSAEAIDNKKSLEGIQVDLNGDGKKEVILKLDMCGTGGCPMSIYDGASADLVGDLFGGRFFVSQTLINGWPILQVYSHGSASSGSFTCYVHDGKKYIQASSVYLYDKSVDQLFKNYETVPALKW